MKKQIDHIRRTFNRQFGSDPDLIASAPGRVNLIGEHTDYMGGLVLPVAIDRQVLFAVRAVPGNDVTGYSLDFDAKVSFSIGEYDPANPSLWLRYVLGVLREIEKLGLVIGGFEFCVSGNIPIGSGLSSSAAVELAACTAVLALFNHTLDKKEAALLCQRAENEFVGMRCGIMDQYICSAGIADHALKIDCASLSHEAVQAAIPGHTWLVIDSRKKRGLVDSEYNLRFFQCHAGLELLRSSFPEREISNLRELSRQDLVKFKNVADDTIFKRIRHVVTENLRVESTCEALRAGDFRTVGDNLYASHQSLRDDFEVSCPELDALVDIVSHADGVVGARLTGAGFGGCIIALTRNEAVTPVLAAIHSEYPRRFPHQAGPVNVWPIRISDGARLVFSSRPRSKRQDQSEERKESAWH